MKYLASGKIIAAAVSVAVAGTFGVGVSGLSSNGTLPFDPNGVPSSYAQGMNDFSKGYRATPAEVDAQANRQNNKSEDEGRTTNNQSLDDAFSQLPLEGQSGSSAYQVSDKAQSGTTVISGNNPDASGSVTPGSGGNTVVGPVLPSPDTPSKPSTGGDSGNTGGSGDSGNTGGGMSSWVNPYPVEDAPTKKLPNEAEFGDVLCKLYSDESTKGHNLNEVTKVSIVQGSFSGDQAFYIGQSLDAWTIFCALNAKFQCGGDEFIWWCDTPEKFDEYQKQYFEIVSYPKKVTEKSFTITVRYRFSTSGAGSTWQEERVSCVAEECALFHPSFKDSVAGEISTTPLWYNKYTSDVAYFFYKDTQEVLEAFDAYRYEEFWGIVMRTDNLSKLLTGWKVDGKDVGYSYKPTSGRHVAEVGEFVDLPEYYTGICKRYWLSGNYIGSVQNQELAYLQTLTGVEEGSAAFSTTKTGDTLLAVPEGFDAIDIEKSEYGYPPDVYTDYISIPSSVIMIDDNSTGLIVNKGYVVDKDNAIYSSTIDGILTNKDKTEYLGVPSSTTDLVVPASVKKVSLSASNNIEHLILQAKSADELPEIDFSTLDNCNIVIDDAVFDSFIDQNYYMLVGSGMSLSRASDPSVEYLVAQGMIYSDKELVKAFDVGNTTLKIDIPRIIKQGSFEGCSVDTIILGNDIYTFEDGCLAGGNVSLIVCNTPEQVAYVTGRLEAAGAPDAEVVLRTTTTEGYSYYQSTVEGVTTTTLLEAPVNLELFEGTFADNAGNEIEPDAIAPKAFINCQSLRWATLGEQTSVIGASAFAGCSNLQGVFIKNPEYISIEGEAFANCSSMQFIASRAMTAYQATTEQPNANCDMYCPMGSSGYYSSFTNFTVESNVNDFDVIRQSNGSLILYGSYVYGEDKEKWIVLKAGTDLPSQVILPSSTRQILKNAFVGGEAPFTINWDDLKNLRLIEPYAFNGSTLSGDVRLGNANDDSFILYLQGEAFYYCPNITSVTIDAPYASLSSMGFDSCTGIEKATINSGKDYIYSYGISQGVISNAPALKSIEFTNPNPADLSLFGMGFGFTFDASRDQDEEEAQLHLEIPTEYQDAYIKAWTYFFTGYATYDELHSAKYLELFEALGYVTPSESQVRDAMAQDLLKAENHLRIMMGAPTVSVSSILPVINENGCTFMKAGSETLLTDVSSDAEEIDLNTLIPDSITEVNISDNAFASCTNVKRIILSDKVKGIYKDAFAGCEGIEIVLPSLADNMPELLGGSTDESFSFGALVKLSFDSSLSGSALTAVQDEYLKTWTWQSYAAVDEFFDEPIMYASNKFDDLAFEGYDELFWVPIYNYDKVTATQLNDAVNNPFLEQENLLRQFMGRETLTDYHDACSFYDVSDWTTASEEEDLNSDSPAAAEQKAKEEGSQEAVLKEKDSSKEPVNKDDAASNQENTDNLSRINEEAPAILSDKNEYSANKSA